MLRQHLQQFFVDVGLWSSAFAMGVFVVRLVRASFNPTGYLEGLAVANGLADIGFFFLAAFACALMKFGFAIGTNSVNTRSPS